MGAIVMVFTLFTEQACSSFLMSFHLEHIYSRVHVRVSTPGEKVDGARECRLEAVHVGASVDGFHVVHEADQVVAEGVAAPLQGNLQHAAIHLRTSQMCICQRNIATCLESDWRSLRSVGQLSS